MNTTGNFTGSQGRFTVMCEGEGTGTEAAPIVVAPPDPNAAAAVDRQHIPDVRVSELITQNRVGKESLAALQTKYDALLADLTNREPEGEPESEPATGTEPLPFPTREEFEQYKKEQSDQRQTEMYEAQSRFLDDSINTAIKENPGINPHEMRALILNEPELMRPDVFPLFVAEMNKQVIVQKEAWKAEYLAGKSAVPGVYAAGGQGIVTTPAKTWDELRANLKQILPWQ
ncbi:MAG: hypothetical protein WC616_01610 [Candidatus Omnitrophota bacterium]